MDLFDYDAVERACNGCMGPCGRCHDAIPFTLDRAIDVFLNRWVHNWRGERAVIEQELRDLIAHATGER